jgi:hypothetical protein
MAVFVSNIVVYTHTDFEQVYVLENQDGNDRLDLTGYSGTSQYRRYPGATASDFTVTFTNRLLGKVKISLSDTETAGITPGKYFFDLKLTKPDGTKVRVVEGQMTVKKTVTR